MSIIGGVLTGAVLGFYFAEKRVPFPLVYNPRTDGHTGYLTLDLQIVDAITRDMKEAVGYGTMPSTSASESN